MHQAAKYFQLSADQGHAISPYNQGVYYEDGYGVTKDIDQAAKYSTCC
mgnify:CR=1 FL=1